MKVTKIVGYGLMMLVFITFAVMLASEPTLQTKATTTTVYLGGEIISFNGINKQGYSEIRTYTFSGTTNEYLTITKEIRSTRSGSSYHNYIKYQINDIITFEGFNHKTTSFKIIETGNCWITLEEL